MDYAVSVNHAMGRAAISEGDRMWVVDAVHSTAKVVFAPLLDALYVEGPKVRHGD